MIGRVQAQYISQILKIVRENPGISRIQLASRMGLDRSSITNLVHLLLKKNLLRHSDGSEIGTRSGRRQIPLEINHTFGVVMGLQALESACITVFTDLLGNNLYTRKDVTDISADNIIDLLKEQLEKGKRAADEMGYPLLGAGIGLPGIIDTAAGSLMHSKNLGIDESMIVRESLQEGFDFPVFIDNDTNCCCWGVLAYSPPEQRIHNFMYVLVEFEDDPVDTERYRKMTTGWAFALNGTVFYGDNSSAGEFKSFLCRNPSNEQFSIDYRTRLKMKNDSVIRTEFLHELSRNIAFTANILNLSHVFLGGNLDTQRSELSDLICKEANINWLYSDQVNLELVFSRSDEHPAATGAAGLALERLFEIPFIQVSAIVKEVFSFMLE